MIDVEKFVGVMKSAGVDFFARVVNSRLKWCCVCAMACALLPLIFGCVQLDLSSGEDCDENSKTNLCDVTSAYWWDWGKSAQELLDDRLQNANGRVDERAFQRLIVSQEWWEVLVTWGSLGIAKPVELTIWFEESE